MGNLKLAVLVGLALFIGSGEKSSAGEDRMDGSSAFKMVTQAKIGTVELILGDEKGRCILLDNSARTLQELGVPSPCGFVRRSVDRLPQSYTYKNVGTVLFVAGPLALDSEYNTDSGVKPSFRCSNEGQAIFINKDGIKTGPPKQIALGFCHLLGFDEKDFYAAAHFK